jgi:carbamoyltransferase
VTDLYVLGINAYDHDVSACLLRNGEIVAAIGKERLTRIKHDMGFYDDAVNYCLIQADIPLARVDLIVRNSYARPVSVMEENLVHHDTPGYLVYEERLRAMNHPLFLTDSERVHDVSHHLAHAYSAFAVSPFEEGVVMVVDGIGNHRRDVTEALPAGDDADDLSREAESYYRFEGTRIEALRKVWMEPTPTFLQDEFYNLPGLGALYSRVSSYVFGNWNRCGEVMGLAAFGRPDRGPALTRLIGDRLEVLPWTGEFRHPWLYDGPGTWEESPHRTEWEDLCRRVQDETERVLLHRARRLGEETGAKNLCLAGGVALNCVANGRIERETPFERVFIQPAAGDDGIAIGCAYYGHLVLAKGRRTYVMRDAGLGRAYADRDVDAALRPFMVRLGTRRRRVADVAKETAKLLVAGKVVGWFQGRSEFGPRALGRRSILADPRDARMKDHVNGRVKHRQGFRPFAPAVLLERAGEVFEGIGESPFMLLAAPVRPEWRDRIPAVVHADGTARVQTVSAETDPLFHALIRAFAEETGVPVVLNTSFNVRGEPIVETPLDAVECFLKTGIDVLAIRDRLVTKTAAQRWLRLVQRFTEEVERSLRQSPSR